MELLTLKWKQDRPLQMGALANFRQPHSKFTSDRGQTKNMAATEPPSQHYNLSYNMDHIPIQRIFHFLSLLENFKAGEVEI